MNLKKTAVAAAVTALAVPAAAQADKPDNAGSQGKAKAEQKRSAKAQKRSQPKSQRVGFTLAGTELAGLPLTTGAGDVAASAFTLDLTSANKHARAALGQGDAQDVTRAFLAGDSTTTIPGDANGFDLRLEGVTDGGDEGTDVTLADVLATDRVKVLGKVVRTRTKSRGSKPAFTYGAIDIRKVVVSRESAESETETTSGS